MNPQAEAATAEIEQILFDFLHGGSRIETVAEKITTLVQAVERERILGAVRRVHRKGTLGGDHCVNCRFAWPCPTEQVLADLS